MMFEDLISQFGSVYPPKADDIYVIPPREHDESVAEWEKRCIRVSSVIAPTVPKFLDDITNALSKMWELLKLVHEADPEHFHAVVANRLGREVDCPVCEARDAAQKGKENPKGEGGYTSPPIGDSDVPV